MIIHDKINLTTPDAPVVFAELGGATCSICAPDTMSAAQVEAWANDHGPKAQLGNWVTVDKSKLGERLGLPFGDPTPNPCNHVAGRRHWFLLDEVNAARLAGEMRR